MGIPSTVDDSLIEMSLSNCGPPESFTRHSGVSSRGEYVLARFRTVAAAQQLLHLQKIVCAFLMHLLIFLVQKIGRMWYFVQPFWRNKTIMIMRRDDRPFDPNPLIRCCQYIILFMIIS